MFGFILLESTTAMPGCLSYVVAADPADPDGLWVTEVWEPLGGAGLAHPGARGAPHPG